MRSTATTLLRYSLLSLLLTASASAYQLHGTFSDHMVLQRDRQIRIYGTGDAGEAISVQLGDQQAATKLEAAGKWQITLPPRKASADALALIVSNGQQTTTFNDIVIGDVWVCSGQSNMGWSLGNTLPLPTEFPHADKLRLLQGQLVVSPEDPSDTFIRDGKKFANGWAHADADNAPNISAVAYYMALEICEQTDIPVGIVVVALGGSQIYPWMSPASMKGHPEESTARAEAGKAIQWSKGKAKEFIANGQSEKAEDLLYSYTGKAPSALYNGMIHPLTNMPITGMLWYQGERSQDNPPPYHTLFPSAIEGWRQAWGQGDFPFVFIQLPAYHGAGSKVLRARGFPLVREAQTAALKLPNTGMAMALDYGHYISVHPQEKHEVGRRAGLQALRLTGHPVQADGPILKHIELQGNRATIQFSSIVDGLETRTVKMARTKRMIGSTDPDALVAPAKTLLGFEVCGSDGIYHPASARIIKPDTIELSAPSTEPITHIRYAFKPAPLCNLYNSEGLPTRPFRTDTFDVPYGSK